MVRPRLSEEDHPPGCDPYVFEREKGHQIWVRALVPGAIAFVDVTDTEITVTVQPPSPVRGRANLPHLEVAVARPAYLGDDKKWRRRVAAALLEGVAPLGRLVAAQAAAGGFRRADPYRALVEAAVRVGAFVPAAQVSSKELQTIVAAHAKKARADPTMAFGMAQLLHLERRHGADLRFPVGSAAPVTSTERDEAAPVPAFPPGFSFDPRVQAAVRLEAARLVAVVQRDTRRVVIVESTRSPALDVCSRISIPRLLGESASRHAERVDAAVQFATNLGPLDSEDISPQRAALAIRWGRTRDLAELGYYHFARAMALLPVPVPARRWGWLVWRNDGVLRLMTFAEPTFALVGVDTDATLRPPTRGAGLRRDDEALANLLDASEQLAEGFWGGAAADTKMASDWMGAAASLVDGDWMPLFEATSPRWFAWLRAACGPRGAGEYARGAQERDVRNKPPVVAPTRSRRSKTIKASSVPTAGGETRSPAPKLRRK